VITEPIFADFEACWKASIFGIIFGWPKGHDASVCGTRGRRQLDLPTDDN